MKATSVIILLLVLIIIYQYIMSYDTIIKELKEIKKKCLISNNMTQGTNNTSKSQIHYLSAQNRNFYNSEEET